MQKRELAVALVDGRVQLKVQLVWSRAATHCGFRQTWRRLKLASRSRMQPAWNSCSHASAARWPSTAAVAVVAAMAAAMEAAAAMRPCFLLVYRGLASGFKGAKRIKHTRRAGDPAKNQWVTRTAAAAASVERPLFWSKKAGSRRRRGAPAARRACCRSWYCCRRSCRHCFYGFSRTPSGLLRGGGGEWGFKKNILGAWPGRAPLLNYTWRLGRESRLAQAARATRLPGPAASNMLVRRAKILLSRSSVLVSSRFAC